MITPAFELSQDHDSITLVLRVPYTRTSEFDVYVDGEEFKFYAKPYFLRLTLPGRIVQDGRERASFDIDKGLFTMRVPKENPGERFEGLQMLTSLLAPKGSRSAKPLVEDLGACGGSDAQGDEEDEEEEEEEDFDWQVEQEAYVESSEEELKKLQKYGFGNLRTGVFSRLQEELSDVIDLKEPENSTPAARRCHRLDAETSIFCADHYLCDLYEGEEMRQVHLNFKPWWSELKPASDGHSEAALSFTDEEKEQMRKFTNRSYPLDKATRHRVWLGLVDVVLAYVYDVRTTEGEHNVESAWTIRKISGTLSWLETYNSLHEVLVSFGRRVLCYPLYRHFSLITTALRDAAHIFQCGKACVLKCLLAVHKIFRQNEPAYILNDLYITDYCVWIQRVKSKHVMALALPLSNAKLDKDDLDLELTLLEKAAELVVEEEAAAEAKEEGQKTEHNEGEDSSSSEEESEQDSGDDEPERENSEGVSFLPQRGNGQPEASVEALALPLPQESQSGGGGEGGGRGERLIQELGERLEEELKICEHQLQTRDSSRRQGTDRGEPRETDGSQLSAALLDPKAAMAKGDLLETRRSKNALRIVDTEELDSDDD